MSHSWSRDGVIVQAEIFCGNKLDYELLPNIFNDKSNIRLFRPIKRECDNLIDLEIKTPKGVQRIEPFDYIVNPEKGVYFGVKQLEFYRKFKFVKCYKR